MGVSILILRGFPIRGGRSIAVENDFVVDSGPAWQARARLHAVVDPEPDHRIALVWTARHEGGFSSWVKSLKAPMEHRVSRLILRKLGIRVSRQTCCPADAPRPSCRVAVKDGRDAGGATCCDVSRPLLDGREHDGMLVCTGFESGGCILAFQRAGWRRYSRSVSRLSCADCTSPRRIRRRPCALGLLLEATPIEQLTFERGEETLRHRVVVGISYRPHRGANACLSTSFAELDSKGILRAMIRTVDYAHGDGVTGPVLAHELEPFGGRAGVKRRNSALYAGRRLVMRR